MEIARKSTFDGIAARRQPSNSDQPPAGLVIPAQGNPAPVGKSEAPKEAPEAPQAGLKQEFEDVFTMNAKHQSEMMNKAGSAAAKRAMGTEEAISKVNEALASGGSGKTRDEQDLDELSKISVEDLQMAEEMVFKGFVEYNVQMANLPNHTFTLVSSTADEIALIEDVILDHIRANEDSKTGEVNLADANVKALRNALAIAMSYKGADGKELCETPIHTLTMIKRAILKCKEYEVAGDLSKFSELRTSLKKSVKARASRVMGLSTPLIDFLSQEKFKFDNKMFTIMTTKNIIPKS